MIEKKFLWTVSGARLEFIKVSSGLPIQWLFLPGGPGLGSEVLYPLTKSLNLPGTIWHLDLPGDGSNEQGHIQDWSKGILEAVESLNDVVLVGHSRGGMFALALPELEKKLKGIVLMSAAPDMSWQKEFARKIQQPAYAKIQKLEEAFQKNPNPETLKELVLGGAPLMFTHDGLSKGIKSLENLPYNSKAIAWTQSHFDPTYSAQWIPKSIPALILSGSEDQATPLKYFSAKKEFHRPNIQMREIPQAGHFPWIEKPKEVQAAFDEFCFNLLKI